MAAMFKKSRGRNFRKKNFNEDEENENEEQQIEQENPNAFVDVNKTEENGNLAKKERAKIKSKGKFEHVPSASSLLSFDDDLGEVGDGEIFKVKKSKESRRLAKMLEKEKKRKDKKKDREPEPVKYIVNKAKVGVEDNSRDNSMSDDHNSEKLAALRAELSKMSKGDDEDEDDDDGENIISEGQFKASSLGSSHVFNIPDAQTIHAARKKREMARTFGTQEFIPLDDTQRLTGRFGTSSSSRLVREDENDESDDEDGPISFSAAKKSHPALERRRQVEDALINQDNEHDEENECKRDEEEELKRWEEEQIRKGVSVPQLQQEQEKSLTQELFLQQQPQYVYDQGTLFSQDYTYQSVPQVDPGQALRPLMSTEERKSVTMDTIWDKINKRLTSLQEVNRGHRMEMDKFQSHRHTAEDTIEQLEQQGTDVEKRFRFFQEMRGYVRDLLECLNEKVQQIDRLEHSLHALMKQRADRLVQRRQEDVKDQDEDFTGAQSGKQSQGTLDEFGRDRTMFQDLSRQRRIAEREGRKKRRRQLREQDRNKGNGKADIHHEGLSSDDEETEAEILKYKTETDSLMKEASAIMDDVVEDFSEISAIKSRFEQWKYFQTSCYKDAYISLCLPKLFTPFVRWQLLNWNPFQPNCKNFEEMPWYRDLLMFGFPSEESIDIEDSDVKLLPSLVEKAVLPKLTGLCEYVWDPMSTKQSMLAVALVQQLAADYPTVTAQNKATQLLFNAIVNRLRRCVNEDIYIPLYPKSLLENKSSGTLSFFQRQFWTCVKLFSNIILWQGLISTSRLQELAMDGLLSRYMLLALQHSHLYYDSLEKCKVIINSIPPQWIEAQNKKTTTSCVEALARYLTNLAACIQRSSAGCSDSEKKKSRSGVKKVVQLLLQLKAVEKAKAVAHEHDMEELVKDVHDL